MNGCERWVLCCHARLPEGRRYAVGHETKGIMTENRNILALDASKIGKRAYRKWLFWLSGLHPDDLIFSRCPCPCILVIKKQMGGSTTLFLTHFCPTLTPRHHGANYGLHARAAQQRHCPSRQRCASHQGAVSAAGCRGCVGLSLCQGLVARQKDPALEKRLAGETPAGWNSFYQMFVYFFLVLRQGLDSSSFVGDLRCRSPALMGPPHVPCHWRPGSLYPAEQRAAGLPTASPGGHAAEVGPCGWEGRRRPDAAGRGQCGHCSGIGGSQEGVGWRNQRWRCEGSLKFVELEEKQRVALSTLQSILKNPENGFHEVCNITAKLGKRMQTCSECSRCRPLHFTEENLSVIPSNTIDYKNKLLNFNEEMRQNGPGTNGCLTTADSMF